MAIIKIKISFKIVNDFFAAVWLPLMIIPCPLIKSIYLSSIHDWRPASGLLNKRVSQSGWKHHLCGLSSLLRRRNDTETDTVLLSTSLFLLCSSQAFSLLGLYITVNIFWLFGSVQDFSLSTNQMVSAARRETVYRVCLLREHRWGFTVRPGSSFVCRALRGVCFSLLGHQMGGVYGIR